MMKKIRKSGLKELVEDIDDKLDILIAHNILLKNEKHAKGFKSWIKKHFNFRNILIIILILTSFTKLSPREAIDIILMLN